MNVVRGIRRTLIAVIVFFKRLADKIHNVTMRIRIRRGVREFVKDNRICTIEDIEKVWRN